MNKTLLMELLGNADLAALAKRHEPHPEGDGRALMVDRLKAYRGQLSATRFVLPIAGIQGSGKSTLLNALAFDEPVLPIDADETTCVPVEIRWAEHPQPQASVHYADGRTEVLPRTEDALRSVVHNESNPGNEKQVQRVVVESDREMFRHGLVLVDLPGTGSLTAANRETTQSYLKEAVGVMFMLRTVPPLTRSEATFVSLQWASLRTALFVQNRWNDESDAEAQAGCEHNALVLKDIAGRAGITPEGPPPIRVVNGYQALRAGLTADAHLMEVSGLRALRTELERYGVEWGERVGHAVAGALSAEVDWLTRRVDQQLGEALHSHDELKRQIQAEQEAFQAHLANLEEHAARLRQEADGFRERVRAQTSSWSRQQGSELRNRMRTKMRAGIVDGPRLARALRDECQAAAADIFETVQQDALNLRDQMTTTLRDMPAWGGAKGSDHGYDQREESTKWESLLKPLGSLGGGLAGAAGGLAAAAAGVAKAGSIGFAVGGPAGAAVGAALAVLGGVLGGLAGMWLGEQSKELVTEQRAKAAEPEVFAAIDRHLRQTSAALDRMADDFCGQLQGQLDRWQADEVAIHDAQRQQSMRTLAQTDDERARSADALQADLTLLSALQARCREVTA